MSDFEYHALKARMGADIELLKIRNKELEEKLKEKDSILQSLSAQHTKTTGIESIEPLVQLRERIKILEAENEALRTFIGKYATRQAICFGQVTAHILSQNQPLVLKDDFTEEEWHLLYAAIEQGIVSLYASGSEISVGMEYRRDFNQRVREKENKKENVLTRLRELASEGRL